MKPVVIAVAITGSVPRKKDNPAVPVTAAEQVESTHEAFEAGATLVHIHVRNDDESPSSDPERFAAVQEGVRKHCPGMIVQFSTGGRGRDPSARGSSLYLKPDMASLSTGSVNFPTIIYENSAAFVHDLAVRMKEFAIRAEIEIFDLSHLHGARRLADEGLLAGLLDLTTTELADEVCGGVFSAGPERVQIGASSAIPVVLAPGCVDMCNFGRRETVPGKYSSRLLYQWNANVTLMRTSIEENRRIGGLIAETANRCAGPAVVLLPLRGVSMLDSNSGPFWDEAADHACFDAIRSQVNKGIPVIEVDSNINDPIFADRAAQVFLELGGQSDVTASAAPAGRPFRNKLPV